MKTFKILTPVWISTCLTMTLSLNLSQEVTARELAKPSSDIRCPWSVPQDLIEPYITSPSVTAKEQVLTPQQQKEDLSCLKFIFSQQYAATDYYAQQGISFSDRIDQQIEHINTPANTESFFHTLTGLHRQTSDIHLAYRYGRGNTALVWRSPKKTIVYSSVLTKNETDRKSTSYQCKGFTPYPVLSQPNAYRMIGFTFEESPPTNVSCINPQGQPVSLPLSVYTPSSALKSLKAFEFKALTPDTLYLRLGNMFIENEASQKKLFSTLSADDFHQNLIIDVRQNHGGSGKLVMQLFRMLHGEQEATPEMTLETKVSLATIASSIHMLKTMEPSLIQASPQEKKIYAEKQQKLKAYFNHLVDQGMSLNTVNKKMMKTPTPAGIRKLPLKQTLVFIVDSECGSNCEKLLFTFYQQKNVVFVGTHSAGAVHFGDLGQLQLPHSKIIVQTGTKYFVEPQNVVEGLGYAPDYYVLEQDPIQAALHLLELRP